MERGLLVRGERNRETRDEGKMEELDENGERGS